MGGYKLPAAFEWDFVSPETCELFQISEYSQERKNVGNEVRKR